VGPSSLRHVLVSVQSHQDEISLSLGQLAQPKTPHHFNACMVISTVAQLQRQLAAVHKCDCFWSTSTNGVILDPLAQTSFHWSVNHDTCLHTKVGVVCNVGDPGGAVIGRRQRQTQEGSRGVCEGVKTQHPFTPLLPVTSTPLQSPPF
jgi:hypothetical protein